MREIKFRAWNPREKIIEPFVDIKNGEPYYKGVRWVGGIVMQYTGLKDKNGVKIYEGDIVETETVTGEHKFAVKYDVDSTSYMCPHFIDDEYATTLGQLPNSIEIIGNIYENPELLTPNTQ